MRDRRERRRIVERAGAHEPEHRPPAVHAPQRVVAPPYALVSDPAGELVTTAQAARAARAVRLRFSDADVDARIEE